MPQPRCNACNHPERAQIDLEILKGVSVRDLAGQFPGLSRSTVDRHKKHVATELKRSRESRQSAAKADSVPVAVPVGSPVPDPVSVIEQAEKYLAFLRGVASQSAQARQWFASVAAVRAATEILTFIAKCDGTMPQAGTRVAVSDGRQTLTVEFLDSLMAEGDDDDE
jgi:hypothetical protein